MSSEFSCYLTSDDGAEICKEVQDGCVLFREDHLQGITIFS